MVSFLSSLLILTDATNAYNLIKSMDISENYAGDALRGIWIKLAYATSLQDCRKNGKCLSVNVTQKCGNYTSRAGNSV